MQNTFIKLIVRNLFNVKMFLISAIVVCLFPSCIVAELCKSSTRKEIKIIMNQQIACKNQCQDFFIENGRIYITAYLNGIMDTFSFDTGANSQLIISSIDTMFKDMAYKRTVQIPRGKSTFYTYCDTANIENELISCKKCLREIYFLDTLNFPCVNSNLLAKEKTLGMNFLFGRKSILQLNFSDKKICVYDTLYPDTANYTRIKSAFKYGSSVFIYLTIDGKEYRFLFDTGNPYELGLLIAKKEIKAYIKDTADILVEGSILSDTKGYIFSTDTNIIKRNQTIYFMHQDSAKEDIVYTNGIYHSNAGLEFLSKYDWIIDRKNKRLYMKPIEIKKANTIKARARVYLVGIQNDKLKIIARCLNSKPAYSLYSIIKSVNGELITKENICHYDFLLNSTADWSNLQVEIE